jgi:uncharacterized protein
MASELSRLEDAVRPYPRPITAFSGGVDSTLVAVVAQRVRGARALAVTGISPSLAASEQAEARALAERLGLRWRPLPTFEAEDPQYRANAGDRCYFCKRELFQRLTALAAQEGFQAVFSGDNLDDLAPGVHRPGLRAGDERGVVRPLVEAGLTKAAVRALATELGLPNAEKPASPCLASRVPVGTPVTAPLLAQVERAEAALRARGFGALRVRHHGAVARIELPPEDLARALALREDLVAAVVAAGYRFVTLDLAGLRSGSLSGPT